MSGERERWELLPEVGLGPLRLGMTAAEVADALQVPGPLERVRGPYAQEDFADGVKVFYDAGRLACVALDALTGPQVSLAGTPLAGHDPERAHRFLLDYAAEYGSCLLYTTDGSRALTDLGLLLRSQQVGDVRLPGHVRQRSHRPLRRVRRGRGRPPSPPLGYFRDAEESGRKNRAALTSADGQGHLTLPVLGISSSHGSIPDMAASLRLWADNVTGVVIPQAGHFIPDEQPDAAAGALSAFIDHAGVG